MASTEVEVITPRDGEFTVSWRGNPLLLACDLRPERGEAGGRSETRPMTGRVSGILDLVAVFRFLLAMTPFAILRLGSRKENLYVFY